MVAKLAVTRWGKDGVWAELHCGRSGGTEEWDGSILLFYGRRPIGHVQDDNVVVLDGAFSSESVAYKDCDGKMVKLAEYEDGCLRLSLGDLFKLGLIINSVEEGVSSDIWEKCPEDSK
jgi:hypothetical protein